MIKIPEHVLQKFMQITGLSHDEARKALIKSLQETARKRFFIPPASKKEGAKYDEENYPDYLPSNHIQKYTIRVSLKGLSPAIWRKFECPSNISLRHFTELVLQLMGWDNMHLNHIETGNDTFYVPFYQFDSDYDYGDIYYQEEYMLSDILHEKDKTIHWVYDFGDLWNHKIKLTSINEYKDRESHSIVFIGGNYACPPEDCGGACEYQKLLDALEKYKSHKLLTSEEKDKLKWAGWRRSYNPEEFDEYACIDICDYFSENEEDINSEITSDDNSQSAKTADENLINLSPLYDDILAMAFRIRELEPWKDINDSDVYAIRMQDGSEIYVATMGNGGGSPEIQLYDGPDSFQHYLTLVKGDSIPQFETLESAYWAKYKAILYEEPGNDIMEPTQYKLIEKWAKVHDVEINNVHGYPFPQFYRPHYAPTMSINDDELLRVKEALEAIEWLSQKIMDTEDLTTLGFDDYYRYPKDKGGKVVPLIVKTADDYKIESTKLPGRINNFEPVKLPDSELQSLATKDKKQTQYWRLAHFPGYVKGEHRDKDYSPLFFICIDKKTEKCCISEPCPLTDTPEKDAFRQYIEKAQEEDILPQHIITDDPRTEAILRHFCQHLGIILEIKRYRIPQLTYFGQRFLNKVLNL